ncbi:spermidine/putrescine ABC transporter permease PotB [Candidatus Purcelliella pentastirinorum]|uniref:spermidine/putrescine ABC transporter permease PotB n=1 Tax=Candidatus Purcelliella pentastirinorum TaxID=472834 RepID=UPI0023677D89|nr:spermidine/putrescine ABC transporter permease PotB [Candidatus Purcelliella pentastirinorum]WDI78773.1 spermidine/putrescine ABC transporter permease PotB [Candidatus Purcelliella pentastirinorum]WDR79907.1 spermidine/putrescine ABC transporter permease PotB [Candidatus Purcelliella pentastirinorum]
MKIKNNFSLLKKIIIIIILIWLITFIFLPNIILIITSFLTRDNIHFINKTITLNNYKKLLNPIYSKILLHSFDLAIISTICCLLIAYPFSWYLTKLKKKIRSFMIFLIIIPFWTNSLIRIYSLKIFISTNGILNKFLLKLHIIKEPYHIIFTSQAIIIGLIYILLPFMILPLYSNLEKMDKSCLEAAKDLGATKIQRFIKIILPLSIPGILTGCILVLLSAMGLFYISDLLGGAKNLLISNIITDQFIKIRDWPFGAATNIMLTIIIGFILIIYLKTINFLKKNNE